jgi:hypothetical protein
MTGRSLGDFNRWWRLSGGSSDPLIDVHLQLDRSCDRDRSCHGHCVGAIGPGAGPDAYSLHCLACTQHCGWLPRRAAEVLRTLYEAPRLSSAPTLFDRAIRP